MINRTVILRGIPGSGKSTYAYHLFTEHAGCFDVLIVSADHSFQTADGDYHFNSEHLSKAHGQCLRRAIQFVQAYQAEQDVLLIVDNTNITPTEIAPYYALSEAYGFEPTIVTLEADWEECWKRNVHRVPELTVFNMAKGLAVMSIRMPARWRHEVRKGGE